MMVINCIDLLFSAENMYFKTIIVNELQEMASIEIKVEKIDIGVAS